MGVVGLRDSPQEGHAFHAAWTSAPQREQFIAEAREPWASESRRPTLGCYSTTSNRLSCSSSIPPGPDSDSTRR